ncbi:phage integrase family protein [Nonomuraea polychroma]|uniref:Phage integrase family protein n=1 Tax=Nonomuraea polychroma TaxID=46176 RepID=A0A438MHW1_9ACTN|nr:phage integrase family protein [Nonomuraea polychroma]
MFPAARRWTASARRALSATSNCARPNAAKAGTSTRNQRSSPTSRTRNSAGWSSSAPTSKPTVTKPKRPAATRLTWMRSSRAWTKRSTRQACAATSSAGPASKRSRSTRRRQDVEIEPLDAGEARDVLDVANHQRNGTRWSVALALGLRQCEALGLRWKYVDLKRGVIRVFWQIKHQRYRHGCKDPHACGERLHRYPCPKDCPKAKRTSGRKHVCNKKGQKFCAPDCTKHAPSCPERVGGWTFVKPKGKSKRTVMIPPPLIPLLKLHQEAQQAEREAAGEHWQDYDLVWCHPDGRPIDPGQDWDEWKELLRLTEVDKDARVHDARHTAATLLIEQGVDISVVQEILGYSQLTTTKRYTHITATLSTEAAARMGRALWG